MLICERQCMSNSVRAVSLQHERHLITRRFGKPLPTLVSNTRSLKFQCIFIMLERLEIALLLTSKNKRCTLTKCHHFTHKFTLFLCYFL